MADDSLPFGSDSRPVSLDPFQTIVEVGWRKRRPGDETRTDYFDATCSISWGPNNPTPGLGRIASSSTLKIAHGISSSLRSAPTPGELSGFVPIDVQFAYHPNVEPKYMVGTVTPREGAISVKLDDTYPIGNLGPLGTWSVLFGTYTYTPYRAPRVIYIAREVTYHFVSPEITPNTITVLVKFRSQT